MRVYGIPSPEAAVGEDDAQLGQFEDGDVDPAAIEQRGGTEERVRQGGQRDTLGRPDHLRADEGFEPALHPADGAGQRRIRDVLVGGGIVKDPVLDGLGVAEAVPGHDPVFEGGLDGGGGLGIERIREVATGAAGVGKAGALT